MTAVQSADMWPTVTTRFTGPFSWLWSNEASSERGPAVRARSLYTSLAF